MPVCLYQCNANTAKQASKAKKGTAAKGAKKDTAAAAAVGVKKSPKSKVRTCVYPYMTYTVH